MATVATKPITAEEFYEFLIRPENHGRRLELERGEIVEMTKPTKFHGFVCGNIARILGNFAAQRKKGYVCTNDTGVLIERNPDTVRGPDILFYEDVATPEEIERKFATTPALLTVEVQSRGVAHGKLMRRVNEQLTFGTKLVWVVDTESENVTVHRADKPARVVESGEELTGEEFLPDLRCPVADFFKMPGQ